MYIKVFILFIIVNASVAISAQEVAVNEFSSITKKKESRSPRKWILEFIHEAERTFDIDLNATDNCKRDFGIYQLHAQNQTVWAIRMMESSEWPRTAIFAGVTTFLGNWAECLRSQGPGIRGQYCLPELRYDFFVDKTYDPPSPRWVDWPEEYESIWSIIQSYRTLQIRNSRQKLTWALCIPSSCTADDLQKSLNSTLAQIFRSHGFRDISVYVDPVKCHTEEQRSFSHGFIYTGLFFIMLCILTITASIYDIVTSSNNNWESSEKIRTFVKLLRCFSILENWKKLTRRTSNTHTGLYCIKFICLIIIIAAHEGLLAMAFPKFEEEHAELRYRPWTVPFVFHCIVDIFFMISGFLTFFLDFERTKKYGVIYYIFSILFRWLRLIPVLAVVLVFFMFVLPYMGDGPLWNSRFMNEVKYCYSNWWTNILAINNIIHSEHMCFLSTWYIAVDMQLAILGGALLVVFSKSWRIGISLTSLTFLLSIAATFYKIYENNYYGVPMRVLKPFDEIRKTPEFKNIYIQVYPRIGPYLLGGALALVVRKLRENKYTFSQIQSITLILTSCLVGFSPQAYGLLFLQIGRPYDALENAVFGSIHRLLFVIPIATLICTYFNSKLVIVSHVLDFKIFVPLGRLAYSAYLVSLPIQLYRFGTFRKNIYVSELDVLWQLMATSGYTLIFAFLLFLISEGPVRNLMDLLIMYIIKKIQHQPKRKHDTGTINTGFSSANDTSRINRTTSSKTNDDPSV